MTDSSRTREPGSPALDERALAASDKRWLTPMWVLSWYARGHAFARENLDKNRLTAIPHGFLVVRNAYRWATGKNGTPSQTPGQQGDER